MKSPRSTTVCSASPISGSDFAAELEEGARLAGDARRLRDVDEQPPAGLAIGRGVVSCHTESPSGFIASVIICWWPTET